MNAEWEMVKETIEEYARSKCVDLHTEIDRLHDEKSEYMRLAQERGSEIARIHGAVFDVIDAFNDDGGIPKHLLISMMQQALR